MSSEQKFYDFIKTLPHTESVRSGIEAMAYQNAWTDGCRAEYKSDEEAWEVAIATAEMISNDPADFGIGA